MGEKKRVAIVMWCGLTDKVENLYIEVRKKDSRTVDISIRKKQTYELFGKYVHRNLVGKDTEVSAVKDLKNRTGIQDVRNVIVEY